jgi:hypothetical protein
MFMAPRGIIRKKTNCIMFRNLTAVDTATACFVRFEVSMADTIENVVFWDVTQCGSCKNRRF